MARTDLATGVAPELLQSYRTVPFQPGAGRLVLAFVSNLALLDEPAAIPTAKGNNLAWETVASVEMPELRRHRLTCFRALGQGPINEELTFDFGTQVQSSCAWSVFEYDGVAGPDSASAVLQPKPVTVTNATALSHTLGALVDAARSVIVGAIAVSRETVVNGGPGFASIDEHVQAGGPLRQMTTFQTQDASVGPSIAWTWAGAAQAAAIVLEVRPVPLAGEPAPPVQPSFTDKLVKQFEPILFFHPDEKFFPSDAKRYIEHCALWKAEPPLDKKSSWGGGQGALFPRKPLIEKSNIAATAGEPGIFLGDNLGLPPQDMRFFELTGWKNAAGALQPAVTGQSQNTYSNRESIAALYNNADDAGGNAELRESKFWYHAELFENNRLRLLLKTVAAPDLVRVLDNFKNAALLNYYFFFPARERMLHDVCTNVEAKEYECRGGDWICLPILLERDDPSAAFRPTFIGHFRRSFREHFEQSPENLQMMISPFAAASPVAEHPRLWVSKRSHHLYLAPGTVSFPVGSADSLLCGRLDSPPIGDILEVPVDEKTESMYVLLAKFVGAGLLNLGPLSLIAGALWAAAEDLYSKSFDSGMREFDTLGDDVTGSAFSGIAVVPKDVEVPLEPGMAKEEWRSAQQLTIGSRRYDFLVDRTKQIWWPTEPGESSPGYNGLWGPLVESDKSGRRSGQAFPRFWHEFFLALGRTFSSD